MLEMDPIAGLMDHTTPELVVPETVALYCWVCPGDNVADNGFTETLTDERIVRFAVAFLVLLATLVAVTPTVCCEETDEGAVYKPVLEIVPIAGLSDHITEVSVVPIMVV